MIVYRIQTGRLVIRCWEPKDAPLLKAAVDVSIEHLLPWMPWAAHEPQTIDEKIALLRRFRGNYDLEKDAVLGIFSRDESEVLGGTGYHPRVGDNEREIGYWVRADMANQGIVTESTAALVKVAFEIEGLHRLEIRCDPENHASAAIPRKLGFTHDATLRKRIFGGVDEPRDVMIWSMLAEEYRDTPAAEVQAEAFDVVGRRVG